MNISKNTWSEKELDLTATLRRRIRLRRVLILWLVAAPTNYDSQEESSSTASAVEAVIEPGH